MLTNWNRIIRIIRLTKGGCFKTLLLSKGNDAWKSGVVDPCAHVQIQYIECFVLEWRNRWHKPKSWIMGENKSGCPSQPFFFISLFISFIYSPSPLCSSLKCPKDKSRLTFVLQSSQWRSWCGAQSTPKTVKADKQLVFVTSWAISTHVTANGPHPQRVCVGMCVCIAVIRPLTSLWPDLSFLPFSDPALPLFISLIQQCSFSSAIHADAPVIHVHPNVKTSKPLTPEYLCQSRIATFTHCDNPLSVKSANCHSMSDGIRCHTPASACHTPSVCQRVTPQWPDFQSNLSSLHVPQPSFWSPCQSTASLICHQFSSALFPVWSSCHGTYLKTSLTEQDWYPVIEPVQPDMSQATLISYLIWEKMEVGRRKASFSLSPLLRILSLSLFFNLALRVKTSIPNQGDVTSYRAWGDSTK